MRITFLAIGTRGDVQPCIALGLGLQRAGHAVRVATHATYETLVTAYGLDFQTITDDPATENERGHWRGWQQRYDNDLLYARGVRLTAGRVMRQRLRECWIACQDAEVIMVSPLAILAGYHLAELLGLPLIRTFPVPLTPTRHYPALFVPAALGVSPWFNLRSHYLEFQALWMLFRRLTNASRAEILHLPPLPIREPFSDPDRRRWPLLYGYSQTVAPRPCDWGSWIHVTGFWMLERPENWRPPSDLAAFLDSGPPPVYVGFGSPGAYIPVETLELVSLALKRSRQRGVLLGRPENPEGCRFPGDVFVTEGVPHDWLFPRMAAVVHHGGAGTTAAALRAGVPSVVVPVMPDGRFWGQRVYELGAGERPIPRHRLTADRLAEAIRAAVEGPGMRQRAVWLGERIRAEDGVARAVQVIGEYLGTGGSRAPKVPPVPSRRCQSGRRRVGFAPDRRQRQSVRAAPRREGNAMEEVPCLLCGCSERRVRLRGFDRATNVPGEFTLVECLGCGFVYLSPRPNAAEIGRYYPAHYALHQSTLAEESSGFLRQMGRFNVGQRCDVVLSRKSSGSLLDVGSSTGDFLAAMQARGGWQVQGLEPSVAAAERARQVYGVPVHQGYLDDAPYAAESFDAVTLWDVFEHVPQPLETLRQIHALLRPSGVLAMSLPNRDALDARLFRSCWIGYDVPRHLSVFSRADITRAVVGSGFDPPTIFTLRGPLGATHHGLVDILVSLGLCLNSHGSSRIGRAALDAFGAVSSKPAVIVGLFLATLPYSWLVRILNRGTNMVVVARRP